MPLMNDTTNIPDIQAALDAGKALGQVQSQKSEADFITLPNNYKPVVLEAILEAFAASPRRLKARLHFDALESFIGYISEWQSGATRIFSSCRGVLAPVFEAVIDYHDQETPSWCEHRATYAPEFTPEWKRWMEKDTIKMSQADFANFLEENGDLVEVPPGAALQELVQNLYAKQQVTCTQLIRLNDGRTKLAYDEEIELSAGTSTKKAELVFPSQLTAAIAPFDGGPGYRIKARLRYRLEKPRLIFWYENVDVHLVIKDAVKGIVGQITEKLKLTPFMGNMG